MFRRPLILSILIAVPVLGGVYELVAGRLFPSAEKRFESSILDTIRRTGKYEDPRNKFVITAPTVQGDTVINMTLRFRDPAAPRLLFLEATITAEPDIHHLCVRGHKVFLDGECHPEFELTMDVDSP